MARITRGGVWESPGQYATPRCSRTRANFGSHFQISLPVSGSSANYATGRCREEHAVANDNRGGFELCAFIAGVISPCPVQARHVSGRDLFQRREMGVDVIVTVGRPIILCPSCRRQQEYDSEGCGLPHRDESIVFLQPRVDEVTPIVRFHRARIFEKRGRSGRITRYSEKASHDIKQYRQRSTPSRSRADSRSFQASLSRNS